MYLNARNATYQADLEANMHSTAKLRTVFSIPSEFSWASVASLGRLNLATRPSNISNHAAMVASVADAADQYLAAQCNQSDGFGVFLNVYLWGSNSNHLNNIQILATAHDLARNETYRLTAVEALDYILGRNAVAQSCVAGYGYKTSENVHS